VGVCLYLDLTAGLQLSVRCCRVCSYAASCCCEGHCRDHRLVKNAQVQDYCPCLDVAAIAVSDTRGPAAFMLTRLMAECGLHSTSISAVLACAAPTHPNIVMSMTTACVEGSFLDRVAPAGAGWCSRPELLRPLRPA
jgi:hypothetical protein